MQVRDLIEELKRFDPYAKASITIRGLICIEPDAGAFTKDFEIDAVHQWGNAVKIEAFER